MAPKLLESGDCTPEDLCFSLQVTRIFSPLSPNIHIQILQTDLYTFPLRISYENLIKDQSIFS